MELVKEGSAFGGCGCRGVLGGPGWSCVLGLES